MVERLQHFIGEKQLFNRNNKILLAVSGGIDSVVLLDLFHQLPNFIGIAHCNFQLRGEESDGDEALVKQLASRYDLPFFSVRFDTINITEASNESVQMIARRLRYDWLEKIRKENDYTFIATAHHQNDTLETLLYNLTKGTGISGLHGIPVKNGKIIRPLMCFNKEEIEAYVKTKDLKYRLDASNLALKYNRNKIRHLVVPALKEINPALEKTVYENTGRFRETEELYRFAIQYFTKKLLNKNRNGDVFLPILKLKQIPAPKSVLYELLLPYGFNNTQTQQIWEALDGIAGKVFYSENHQLIKDRKHLIISEKQESKQGFSIIQKDCSKLTKEDIELIFLQTKKDKHFNIHSSKDHAYLDIKKITFPLMLRKWKPGDYFYPFGMKGKKKKVNKFFKDEKISLIEKERTWILEDAQKRILWVVGYRIDERFKIKDNTREVLLIKKSEV